MAYIRVIPNTIELLLEYLALLYQYYSVISFSQVFSAFLLGVRVAFRLIHRTFDVSANREKEFFSEPYCLVLNRFVQEEW